METGPHESEGEMIRHGSGETMATLTTAAILQREATDQHLVFAWGQALFKELDRVWAQPDAAERLAYEDKLAAQVHVLEDASVSLGLLAQSLRRTGHRLQRYLQSLRSSHAVVEPKLMP
jgi:hypothetical protein